MFLVLKPSVNILKQAYIGIKVVWVNMENKQMILTPLAH